MSDGAPEDTIRVLDPVALQDQLFQMSESDDPDVRAYAIHAARSNGLDISAHTAIQFTLEVVAFVKAEGKVTCDMARSLASRAVVQLPFANADPEVTVTTVSVI